MASKKKSTEPKKRRMLIVDAVDQPVSAAAAERASIVTLPCKDCGEETTPANRSILKDGRTVHIGCVPKKSAKTKAATAPKDYGDVLPMVDYQGRTCIQVRRDDSHVAFIPMSTGGFFVDRLPVHQFDGRFKPIEKYPVEKACSHFVRYATEYGATKEVLDYLAEVVPITEEQHNMAKKKADEKITTVVNEDGSTTTRKRGGGGEKRESASGMFKALIMEGKLSDEDIFKKVQDAFGLDEKKRSYVAWYRNWLKKAGQNPPEAKASKGEAKKAEPKSEKKPVKKAKK